MSTWVDFKALRKQLDVAKVLSFYRIEYKRKGLQAQAFCPLPSHQGNRKTPSFSISFEKKIFQCFGCGAKGNILELVAILENLDPVDPMQLREAALRIQRKIGVSDTELKTITRTKPIQTESLKSTPAELPVIVNAPLDFELKNLNPQADYLLKRGFAASTIERFSLGFCSKGLLAGRIAIPLHDMHGRLVGYAGRLIFDDAIDADNPKYLFPSKRVRQGRVYEFAKSLLLYNGHNIKSPVNDLVVMEGFPSVWWLWQHSIQDVVALMGSNCSETQADFIVKLVKPKGRVWIFTDADEAGIRCAQSLLTQVAPHRFCRWVKSTRGIQPTDCSGPELAQLLPIAN